jgi:hypothetical protein
MNRGNASGRYSRGATRSLVDEYLCADGRPIYIGGTSGAWTPNPLFKGYDGIDWGELDNRDPRLIQTVCKPGQYITIFDRDAGNGEMSFANYGLTYPDLHYNCPTANQVPTGGPCITGYFIVKQWTPSLLDNAGQNNGQQTALIFRLGEAMLIYAEAKAELGTITDADLDITVNRLRERAGFDFTAYPNAKLSLSNIPNDDRLDEIYYTLVGYVPSPILREIRRERRVELAIEGMRNQDLVRWKAGKLMEVPLRGVKFCAAKQKLYDGSNANTKNSRAKETLIGRDVFLDSEGFIIAYPRTGSIINGTLTWHDRYYFWPIPLRELELNKNLKQNPGWLDIPR